jgi:hypothetical protein
MALAIVVSYRIFDVRMDGIQPPDLCLKPPVG